MRTTTCVIVALLSVSPVLAQSRAYTDADLGHRLSSDRACPELALATWLDHTGGIPPTYAEFPRPDAPWIVGPVSDFAPTLSPTLPLSADAGYCYGCGLTHGYGTYGHGYVRRGRPDPVLRRVPPIASPNVVMRAVAGRR